MDPLGPTGLRSSWAGRPWYCPAAPSHVLEYAQAARSLLGPSSIPRPGEVETGSWRRPASRASVFAAVLWQSGSSRIVRVLPVTADDFNERSHSTNHLKGSMTPKCHYKSQFVQNSELILRGQQDQWYSDLMVQTKVQTGQIMCMCASIFDL
jgi:hypothetical protein